MPNMKYQARWLVGAILVSLASNLAAQDAVEPPTLGSHLVPKLGQAIAPHDVSALYLAVFPDGRGLPEGSGSVAQGAALYQTHCMACHGTEGRGGINDALAGGQGSLNSTRPLKTVGSYWPSAVTVFSFVRRAMPYQSPGALSDEQVYALTAYLLFLNGIVEAEASIDAQSLPRVSMPNADGFLPACCSE